MTPKKCISRECPLFCVFQGKEACTVRVDEYNHKAFVKPVFDVSDKECRQRRKKSEGGSL